MKSTVRELMETKVETLDSNTPAIEAARRMREKSIGDVLVTENDSLCGIVTDRDLVVRCMANGDDPSRVRLRDLCSTDLVTMSPDEDTENAVKMMKEKAIRRLPIVEGGKPVGILSIGDLAIDRDRKSALAEISAASPNK